MWDFFTHILDTDGFPPRWQCGTWSTWHGALHIAADLGIWSAYVAIPCVLAWFLWRRPDWSFRRLQFLFVAFILACGLSHLLEALMFWWPAYRLTGIVKFCTAWISWATVLCLVPVIPRVLALRSPLELSREIDQRRQAEQVALTQAQDLQKQAALLELAHDAIFVRDLHGRIVYWNRGAEEMYGWKREQALAQSSHELLRTEFPVPLPFIESAVLGKGRWEGELTHTCSDGTRLVVASRWALQRDEHGNPQAFLEINSDITRQKRVEEEVRQANARLDRRVQERTAELVAANAALQGEIQERLAVEERLRASERIYRAIGESIDFGVWICDRDGRNTYASPSFLTLVGITQEQCSEFGWGDVLHPDDAERTIAAWKECVRTRGKWDIEHRFRGVDGAWHPVLARGVPVEDEAGNIACWAGINVDISRLKRAEDSLRELNANLEQRVAERSEAAEQRALALAQSEAALKRHTLIMQSVLNAMDEGVVVADPAGRIVLFNRAAQELHRHSPRPDSPEDWSEIFSLFLPDGQTPFPTADLPLLRALRGEPSDQVEMVVRRRETGRWVDVSVTGRPLFADDGSLQGGVVVLHDITAKKLANAALRESEEKFRNAFDHAPVGMFLSRLDGSWMQVNPALCRMVGYNQAELLATHWTTLTHPDDIANDLAQVNQLLAGKINHYHLEKRYHHKDGHIVWIILGGSLVHDVAGKPLYFVGHVNDITARKKAENTVQLALQEKEVLLKEIHHRVKNNLQVISSLLQLQSQHTADPSSAEMFRESQHRVRSMALVHERLYRSADFAQVDFNDYIAGLANYLFQSYRVDSDAIELKVNLHDVHLSIDAAVPCGLLVNELVSNCLKHAFKNRERGCIRIELSPVGDHEVLLAISDDGNGLPSGIHVETAGTFGLELVMALVDQLHGKLEVKRSPGTTISILFPVAKLAAT